MAEYRSQYYALKSSISEQKITIEDALKIRMLNNLGLAFKTYLTVVNDRMRTDKKLEDDEVLFKAIEEEKTRMKVEQKASANFASTKSKSQGNSEKKTFSEWPKCKKCGCKHLQDTACRHVDDKCDKCHKKGHISRFHDSYTSLNKSSLEASPFTSTFTFDSSKTKSVTCVTRATANKMANTKIRKVVVDSGTTQHLIANRDLIQNYYDDYSEYHTGSGEVLPSYDQGTVDLPLDNGSLTLLDVWYAPDIRYNFINTIQLGKKGVEMWLCTADQPSQILHNGSILGYADPIDGQYVFRLQEDLDSPSTVVNSANILRQAAKLGQIEL